MQRDDSDEFPLPLCAHCGEQLIEGSHKVCSLCENTYCDWCYEEHLEECRQENGQFGVGA